MGRTRILVLLLALIVAGCESQADQMLKAGYPPAYVAGYGDGSRSGEAAAGNPYSPFTKDVPRYDSDSQYRQGWDDGFAVAKGRYESLSRY